MFGLMGASINWRGMTIYPPRQNPYGVDALGASTKHFGADLLVSLYDVWPFPDDVRALFEPPWMAWTPVDGQPPSPAIVRKVKTAEYPVAMSLFGKDELWKAGVEADYIPLGIDCDVFKPRDKEVARQELGIPQDVFLVTMVAANKGWPSRKSFPEALAAFALFQQRHDEAILYLHTTRTPLAGRNGIFFDPLLESLGIAKAVTYADQEALIVGVPDEQLALIYQASDVLLNPAMGEGFCLPSVEAQACGTPVVTQDFSAMADHTVNGIAVEPGQPFWIIEGDYWWRMPNVDAIDAALEEIYQMGDDDKASLSLVGVEFMLENYGWPVVMEKYWKPFLERVEAELW